MKKTLYRSRDNRMIAGVAGGLADYFDIDPVIVRAAFVITTLGWGIGLLAYIVLWIITPNQAAGSSTQNVADSGGSFENGNANFSDPEYTEAMNQRRKNRKMILGIVLVFFGVLLLIDTAFPIFDFEYFWPIAMIALGSFILFKTLRNNTSEG